MENIEILDGTPVGELVVVLSGESSASRCPLSWPCQAGVQLSIEGDSKMESLSSKPIYQMSIKWLAIAGQIHLPNSLYDSSFLHHWRVLGLVAVFPCLDSARWRFGK